MILTEVLYDRDSHLCSFDAQVEACEPAKTGWAVFLNRTAFFPEGGGQGADTGTLGGAAVLDVQQEPRGIAHYTDAPLTTGSTVHGELNWARRFRHMQNHSGEHIVSGLIHTLYGLDNVGFHLGEEDVTIDTSGELTRDQLLRVEALANDAVFRNLEIRAEYPSEAELRLLSYRSKLNLTEHVRIVTIPGIDCCACCAPHVTHTGEIGLIKLLDFMRFRGGSRIHLRCGSDALADYNVKYRNLQQISALLSAQQAHSAEAVQQFYDAFQAEKRTVAELKRQLAHIRADALPQTAGGLCLFENGDDETLREIVNTAIEKCGTVCGVFCGNDTDGYRYILRFRSPEQQGLIKCFNQALQGRGGGRDGMVQGRVLAAKSEIENWFIQNTGYRKTDLPC